MKTNDEIIFAKCKESLEDVVGWKIFIFLPHNFTWRLFIVSTVIFTYIMRTFEFFYGLTFSQYYFMEFVCNVFYFGDTLCATLHAYMVNTRKLRHGKKRYFLFLFIDYVSLIPFDMFYRFFINSETENIVGDVVKALRINVCFRMYQIFLIFSDTRYWIYEMRINLIIQVLAILLSYILVTHLFGCIFFYYLKDEEKRTCLKVPLNCVVETELLMFSLLSQSYMEPSYADPLVDSMSLISIIWLFGYFLTYGLILPTMYFALFFFLLRFNEYSNRSMELDVLLNNLTSNKVIREKIYSYFHIIWTFGKGNKKPNILDFFPNCLQKSIFCDVHWDAFKHSEFLRDLSLGCKRSLSLRMKKEFVGPNNILLEVKQKKESFLYLESGIIQIMAEENDMSPVVAFSGGTVLGEMSLLYQVESKVILKTAKLCVIHYLRHEDFVITMLHFPNEFKKVFRKLHQRMEMSRATYERKRKIYPYFVQDRDASYLEKGNIKWIKEQYRSVLAMQKWMDKEQKMLGTFVPQTQVQALQTQLDHTSVYLSLIAINDEVINKYDTVCLRIRPLWFMDPDCSFLKIWNKVILFFTFVTVIVYPIFIGWFPQLPLSFFNLTIITSFIYITDVFIFLLTAVKDKNIVITSIGDIFVKKLGSFQFYFDFIAAIPFQIFMYLNEKNIKPYFLGLCLINNFFKCQRLFLFLGKWNYEKTNEFLIRTIIKNLFWLFVGIYWTAMFFKLMGVECILYDCGKNDWYTDFKTQIAEGDPRNTASFYLALFLGLDLPHVTFKTSLLTSFLLYLISFFFFRMCILVWTVEIVSSGIHKRLSTLSYRKLIEVVNYFLHNRRISGRILDRVNDTLIFQWHYDRGNYITQESRLVDDIPQYLRDLLNKESFYHTLQNSPIFKMEDEDFMMDLSRKAQRMALPANSVLITFGVQTMCLYMVHKGYVQVNSFLEKDIVSNVGAPLCVTTGESFPVIIAFNQIPAVVTARTLTDCELIVLKLEDILTVMFAHQVLRDVVLALKTIDLTRLSKARPGLSKVEDLYSVKRINFVGIKKSTKISQILQLIFYRKAINTHSKRYLEWEMFRFICIFLGLFSWPFVYGCLISFPTAKWYTTLVLLVVDSTTWIDMYLRTRAAYYNRKGIYISHPFFTMFHYLTSAFVVDVCSFLPYFHIIYLFHFRIGDYSLKTFLLHMFLRSFNFYRIFGFLNYISNKRGFAYHVEFARYLLFCIFLINAYVNVVVYQKTTGGQIIGPYEEEMDSTFGFYLSVLIITLRLMVKINYYPDKITWKEAIFIFCVYFVSKFVEIMSYSFCIISFFGDGKRLSDYQYSLRSFIKFLNDAQVEDKYVMEVIEYYEHLWSEMQGMNFNSVFSRFPNILHEDIVFAVYKSTLRAVVCLSQANEAFYRIIARNVEEIYMVKGSIIILENQVNTDIFFIHKGKCEVKDTSIDLCKGSMIGDILGKGLMKHTIAAKTHVSLLKIPSSVFFAEMDSFVRTRQDYQKQISKFDDYVESRISKDDGKDDDKSILKRKASEMQQGDFEKLVSWSMVFDINRKKAAHKLTSVIKSDYEKLKLKGILHPDSTKWKTLNVIFLIDALLTVLLIPIFIGTNSLTPLTLITTYVLDFIWIIKIGVTIKTAIINPKTGIVNFNKKAIFKKYLYKKNGFVFDVLTVLPFETVAYLRNYFMNKNECYTHYFILRLLRFFFMLEVANKDREKLSVNTYFRWCVVIIMKMAVINVFVCLTLLVAEDKVLKLDKCYSEMSPEQWKALSFGYLCVINNCCGAGATVCVAEGRIQIGLEMAIALWSSYTKATLFTQVAVLIFRIKGSRFQIIRQLQELESYLVARNVSPALLNRVKRYFINLIDYCREEGMPAFLKTSPDFIKFHVMGVIYVHHLTNCRIFKGVDENFLMQLATRLERFVFFPGNYITMQGDIDHCMYFVHRGEIYCLEKDKEYITLERPIEVFVKNECFGMLQGLFIRYPHPYSYRAKTLAEVLVLNYKDWEDMRTVHPDITEAIYEEAMKGERTMKYK